jgi:hypothetical protein
MVATAFVPGIISGADPIVLSGHVERTNGNPFPGVTISIRNMDTNVSETPILTDAGGNFEHEVLAGVYEITASYEGYRSTAVYSGISISTSSLSFVLYEVLGTVSGHVTDGVSTLTDVMVSLTNANSHYSATTTAPYGSFKMENVTPGVYVLRAFKNGYNSTGYPNPITIVKGSDIKVNLTLETAANYYGMVRGSVLYNGNPLEGARVVLSMDDKAYLATVSDRKGNYSFTNVAPGDYELLISKNGYVGQSIDVSVSPLVETVHDATLERDSLPGTSGFIKDFDLAHSLMVIAIVLTLLISLGSLLLRNRVRGRPDLLEKDNTETDEGS